MDITEGPFRERTLIKRFAKRIVERNSPMFNSYIEGISEMTDIPEERVRNSAPAQKYLKKLTGLE